VLDYHREFLTNPAQHGLRIESFTSSDGTPCLIVTPDPGGHLGKRGVIIRDQLGARGHTLPPKGEILGTLVLAHGRKGRKEDYLPIAERLCAAGFRCVIPDLPGHGDHADHLATYGIRESGLPHRVLHEAANYRGFDPGPAGLLGMSMGGSVAVHAAARDDAPWRALVVISSFDALQTVIHGQSTRYAGALLGEPFGLASGWVYQWKSGMPLAEIQPHRHAAAIGIPTLMAHGTADQIIPITSGRKLFSGLPRHTPQKWIDVPGADHDNVLITDFPIYAEIAEWMLRHVPMQ
jgi:alpha-beta hydrolase superfamily lysophospholipase